jgi:DNA-binding NtrC family response regulator
MSIAEPKSRDRTTSARILVVDDHPLARESIAETIRRAGYIVETCPGAEEALDRLEDASFHLIITDLKMAGMDGIGFLRALSERPCGAQVVMITAHATLGTAVEAMRFGAYDYIEKPFNAESLERTVAKALEHGRLVRENRRLRAKLSDNAPRQMWGQSAVMERLRERMAQVAASPVTVLVQGESGTGKELVARGIHEMSDRCSGSFVKLNCAALSASLMESELFGHEKGSFTGADQARAGRFESAHGGTLLLDEVSEIEPTLQAKLLRVLQEKEFERVGSSVTRRVDVRVIATTNRDLQKAVAQGDFREDLYFRLNVLPIEVPALRHRRQDIPELVEHFLARHAEQEQAPVRQITREAVELLMRYDWPGNVRELENLVERACVLDPGPVLKPENLRPWLSDNGEADVDVGAGLTLKQMERKLIEATLRQCHGHRVRTAEALGIGVRTLTGKLRTYGYPPRGMVPEGD